MACELQTLDGCKIEVANGIVTADCSAALTFTQLSGITGWTVVGGIETGGYAGQEWNTSEFKPLAGGKKTSKAGMNPGTMDCVIAWEKTDAGMIALEAAYKSKTAEVTTKITYPNGEIYYAQGIVTKLGLPNGGQDDVMKRELGITLNYEPVNYETVIN